MIMGIPGFKMDIVFGLLVQGYHIGCPIDTSLSRKYSRLSDSDREQERSAEHYRSEERRVGKECT